MKRVILIIDDDHDDVLSITAVGTCGNAMNVCTRSFKIDDGDIIYIPTKEDVTNENN